MNLITWLSRHMLPCPFKSITGLDCPGCGMQRSIIELLKGNWADSFSYYPPLLPVVLTLILVWIHLKFKLKHGAALIKYSYIITIAIILINYIFKILQLKG